MKFWIEESFWSSDTKIYIYDYTKPGKKHVEEMKILAESGKGLTTYVNQNVKKNYKEKVK